MPKAKKASQKGTKKKTTKKTKAPKKIRKASKKSKPQAIAITALAQPCLSLTEAAFIVGSCLPAGTHSNDATLQQAGLTTEGHRLVFRQCVFNGVLAAGCQIQMGQIPNSADTIIGAVIQALFQSSQ